MDCNHHHVMPVEYSPWPNMDGLNNAFDPITILTDADLQNELSLYATTQFTFDGLPTLPPENKSAIPNHFNRHPPPPPSSASFYSDHRAPNLVINTTIKNNDHCSSTISSPIDPQQHYFTPIPSLPTSPMLNDIGDQINPMLTSMLSPPTVIHHLPNAIIQDPHAHYMNRSASIGNDIMLNTTQDLSPTTSMSYLTHRSATPRRSGGSGTHRGRPRRQQQLQQDHHATSISMTPAHQAQVKGDDDNNDVNNAMDPLPSAPVHNSNNSNNNANPMEHNDSTAKQQKQQPEARLSKRQRNTAASARFRIKKKMREQSLQRTACEMTNRANFMENKVHELEREIQWLKTLLIAKNGCSHC